MQVIKAPNDYDVSRGIRIFLAGSIEMGKAVDWQTELQDLLSMSRSCTDDLVVLNPRRDDWDSSWCQDRSDANFVRQVEWELRAQEWSDLIAFYFAPETKSPVTMLELGLAVGRYPQKAIVCCPDEFWRAGNVDITCTRYGVKRASNINELAVMITGQLSELRKVKLASIWEDQVCYG